MTQNDAEQSLPDYAVQLDAYHRAYEPELRAMLASLAVPPEGRILDLACGDAIYGRWLCRLHPSATVVALDIARPWLDEAARRTDRVLLCQGAVDPLCFGDDTFDLVWCAQSLFSIPDAAATLREMVRVARPAGVVAVMEDDSLHQVILPWPVEFELSVRRAEREALARESRRPSRYYIGRWMVRTMREAGLRKVVKKPWASNRQAPLDENTRVFLREYLQSLERRAGPFLKADDLTVLRELADPSGCNSLLNDPDLSLTCLDFLVQGVKP